MSIYLKHAALHGRLFCSFIGVKNHINKMMRSDVIALGFISSMLKEKSQELIASSR